MTDETRYQRTERRKREKQKHAEVIAELSSTITDDFEWAAQRNPPACRTESTFYHNPWTDWDPNPEEREPTESDAPSRNEARLLCGPCPLAEMCEQRAIAIGLSHGIVNGKRIYKGKWL